MGLDAAGRHGAARAAYRWLAGRQRCDGAWAAAYLGAEVMDPTLDANFCAYPAVGLLHHFLCTGDLGLAAGLWPMVERAVGFVLALQAPSGAIAWARDARYRPWPGALLTSSACIYLSLGCAIRLAGLLERERPEWELARAVLGYAVAEPGAGFIDKARYSMDWYYPVLAGVVEGEPARAALAERWPEFVIEGRGTRCVSDRPWVTAGETCELAMACQRAGLPDEAGALMEWVEHLRAPGGAYWTGATFPDGTVWPRERTTWSAGAVLLAWECLEGGPAAGIFCDAPQRRVAGSLGATVSSDAGGEL